MSPLGSSVSPWPRVQRKAQTQVKGLLGKQGTETQCNSTQSLQRGDAPDIAWADTEDVLSAVSWTQKEKCHTCDDSSPLSTWLDLEPLRTCPLRVFP